MGYILPIENYQYQQYQNRVTQPQRDPYPIERLYPAQLDMAYEKQSTNEDDYITDSDKPEKKKQRLAMTNHTTSSAEKVYAEMTGIGRTINKTV
ncbi:hypothetical protein GCM10011351_07960 [Paraliobacillus quinghaiensis]|uniref:Uncharacterized protein n=1 Tax=Paraliobacillus quinghaiensis TaxID=470815 RepID=A0A917TIZ9_9BACI|nr:hypothetical protein [Paraliobacillus quinghaiensis]GGM24628.1 hypothetical protein GCM10011351_07960 [Paraliobacillus quinghaiensis]